MTRMNNCSNDNAKYCWFTKTGPQNIGESLMRAIKMGWLHQLKYMVEDLGLVLIEQHADLDELLMEAMEYEHKYIVKYLIDLGADVRGHEDDSPLHVACSRGNSQLAKLLLEAGAGVNKTDAAGRTPLHCAVDLEKISMYNFSNGLFRETEHCESLSYNITKLLLDHKANTHSTDYFGQNPLHLAASCGNCKSTSLLLEHGANIERTDEEGRTPLHCAVKGGNINTVNMLLEAGGSPKSTDSYGNNTLHEAVIHGAEMTLLLIGTMTRLCEFVNKEDSRGLSPIHLAAAKSDSETLNILIHAGADVEKLDYDDNTPLLSACNSRANIGHNELNNKEHSCQFCRAVSILLEEEADIHHINKNGFSALHMATMRNLTCVVQMLLERGISVNNRNDRGEAALHLGVKFGCVDICDLLCKHGADIELRDTDGRTPLQMIKSIEDAKIRKTLLLHILELDPDINSKDKQGNSLLCNLLIAPGWIRQQRYEVIVILLEHGADVVSDPVIEKFITKYSTQNIDQIDKESSPYLAFTLSTYKMKFSHIYGKSIVEDESTAKEVAILKSSQVASDYDLSYFTLLISDIHLLSNRVRRYSGLKEYCHSLLQPLDTQNRSDSLNHHPLPLDMIPQGRYMANKLKTVLKRVQLLEAGYNFFEHLYITCNYPRLPHPCFEAIVSQLSNNDLRNICRSLGTLYQM